MNMFQLVAMGIDENSGVPREIYSKTVFRSMKEAQEFMEAFYHLVSGSTFDDNHPIGIRVFELEMYDGKSEIKRIENFELPLLSEENLRHLSSENDKELEEDILNYVHDLLED